MENLPLPLSTTEHYLLADDHCHYPANFWIYLEFTGRFHHEYFKTALQETLKFHPRLRAIIPGTPKDKTKDLKWVEAQSMEPYINWDGEDAPLNFPKGLRINLQEELGVRIFIREGAEKTKLYFQVHHVCCDGLSMIQILKDFFQSYKRMIGDNPTGEENFHPLTRSSSSNKNHFWKKLLWSVPKGIIQNLRFFAHPVQPLAIPGLFTKNSEIAFETLNYQWFSFNREDTQKIIRVAARQSATLNDLLLRDLFLTLKEWNEQYHPGPGKGYIRVLQPINLRTSFEESSQARNETGLLTLDIQPKHISRKSLLRRVLKITRELKNLEEYINTTDPLLRRIGNIRGGMPWLAKEERLLYSIGLSLVPLDSLLAFSNLPLEEGRISLGPMKLENVLGFAPIRKTSPAAIGAMLYAKRLSLNVHYDPRTYNEVQAKELLNRYVGQVKISIESNI